MVTETALEDERADERAYRGDHYPPPYSEEPAREDELPQARRRRWLRLNLHPNTLLKSLWGRVLAGCAVILLASAGIAAVLAVRSYLLHDEHFVVPSSEAIQIAGNSRLSRAQLLSVFGEDVERNIFKIDLNQRRAQLESLPWVEHATVMRLLPNRIRISIVERRPVAFVRHGSQIGLVDASGVLLDLPGVEGSDGAGAEGTGSDLSPAEAQAIRSQTFSAQAMARYSFPVLTGISTDDPLSTRAARMRLYTSFLAALDAGGEPISHKLSEVDVTSPEDVRAILTEPADASSGPHNAGILIHFGDSRFLDRYKQYELHLAEWRSQYPKLASVDMRYDRQVVLEMQPGASAAASEAATPTATPSATEARPSSKPAPVASDKPARNERAVAAVAKAKTIPRERVTAAAKAKAASAAKPASGVKPVPTAAAKASPAPARPKAPTAPPGAPR